MSAFDADAAVSARMADPTLTVFDTGEMLEPHPHAERSGLVDFDDDGGDTVLTVLAYPSKIDADTTVLEIDAALVHRLRIVVNDGNVAEIATDGRLSVYAANAHDIDAVEPFADETGPWVNVLYDADRGAGSLLLTSFEAREHARELLEAADAADAANAALEAAADAADGA